MLFRSSLVVVSGGYSLVLVCGFLIAVASLVAEFGMLKILQARLQQHVNRELPDVQAGFRKGRGTRDQIANSQNYSALKKRKSHHMLQHGWK